jgi:hypothetical protein
MGRGQVRSCGSLLLPAAGWTGTSSGTDSAKPSPLPVPLEPEVLSACGGAIIGRTGTSTNVDGSDGAFSRPALAMTTAM